jgi:hypothetical protein
MTRHYCDKCEEELPGGYAGTVDVMMSLLGKRTVPVTIGIRRDYCVVLCRKCLLTAVRGEPK